MTRTTALAVAAFVSAAAPCLAQDAPPIDRNRDRGPGVPTSMFGTYIEKGQFLVYPFFEYYLDNNYEYEAVELGYPGGDTEFRGRYRAKEGLFMVAYGITENLAVEFEAAAISASFEKSPLDTTPVPARLEESGIGDVEGQIRWRWNKETDSRPMWFSYFETVFPSQDSTSKPLTGTPGFEYKFGTGLTRGLSWGTVTLRVALEHADGQFEPGEYAFEYLRRLNRRFRFFAGIEGSQDEVEAITEAQVFLTPRIILKLNNAFGVTSKATDWAPEVGVMFVFP